MHARSGKSGTLSRGPRWHIAKGAQGGSNVERDYLVVQANLQRKKLATQEAILESQKRGAYFALIQEPYVGSEGEMKQARGYRVIQKRQYRTKPVKSAIVVFNNDVEVVESPEMTTENIVVAVLKTST